jgi:hypothetical protein
MKYQIDQSGKIEQTHKPSYVCLANGQSLVISISASDKRELKLFFREIEKPLIFKLFTFSILCARAIIAVSPGSVTIDQEYTSHERQIKSFILQVLRIENVGDVSIYFRQVGKGSSAHKGAYIGLIRKKSDIKVTTGEILKYYEKINKK